jgi:putative serine protease PepD
VRWVPAALALVALVLATLAYVESRSERAGVSATQVAAIDKRVRDVRAETEAADARLEALAKRMDGLAGALKREQQGLAPVAARVLRSVFTVEAGDSVGTAFAAWKRGGTTYLLTARHVVADQLENGEADVRITRGSKTWSGRVIRSDEVNDLALISTRGDVGNPLWPNAKERPVPDPGDQLLLVGSPYGLEGTITTGIVSRVTYNRIQTDAAANPGNSGGPALDHDGKVVGVLLEGVGDGENLNFAVPIERACVVIRGC